MVLFALASRGARSFGVVAGHQRGSLAFAMSGAQQKMMSSVADRDNILPVSLTFPVDLLLSTIFEELLILWVI